jgi:hypothetical protein
MNELTEKEMAALFQNVDAQKIGYSKVLHDVKDVIENVKDEDYSNVELLLHIG